LSNGLSARGVTRDQRVAILLPRGLDFITAMLAIQRAGAAFLPLDVRHPASRTKQILDASSAVITLDQAMFASLLRTPAPPQPFGERRPADLAYVMYTSGSTGTPKGVMVEHRGMLNHILAKISDLGMNEVDALAQNGPPTFDIIVWQCLAPLVVGGRVVVFPDDVAESPSNLLSQVTSQAVTVLQVVPSMLRALLDEPATTLPSLRWIVPTGEALPTDLCRRWLARHAQIPLLNTYGSTECSDDQCHYAIHRLGKADEAVAVASLGTPIRNLTAYVLDERLSIVPTGVVGELYIGGIGVGRGYLNDPEKTARAFIPDPYGDKGARLYRTRDLVRRRADGNLEFIGRSDDVIKLHGFRMEPGEIVAALTSHEHVASAVVVAREQRLVAYVVGDARAPELKRFLGERLPHYMVPATFCFLDALPLSENGKLDATQLPAPDRATGGEQELIPPRTTAEKTLARIWEEVLGTERIGVNQDFFAIGGDSIRSIQIVARCGRAGLHIRPADVFLHPTVAELATFVEANSTPNDAPMSALEVNDSDLSRALGQVRFDEEA
ncbi:MAG: non-ribosomal peptide synthetase, partial [Myxococcales bacterium]|nr:non-ribosomal peptide synthetase [Myxococcales bacterium]